MSDEQLLDPVHPGDVLLEDFMKPLGLSQAQLARAMRVPRVRVSQIVRKERGVTADTALRLARVFGTSPQLWMNLQSQYDLEIAQRETGQAISQEVEPLSAAG
ncbi:MAG: HigA family addiction module antidote protein [Alphaproteobacteria bacterium]|nr:HigA family addiction module antidote protein [Alphaproteobacteria bacterium]